MRNENLRGVCADLGFRNVATVISSGNIVFEAGATDTAELESTLETAWEEQLGFASTTIIRARAELESLIELAPFGELEHGPASYLLVTFCKNPVQVDLEMPHRVDRGAFRLVGTTERELFTVTDTTSRSALDVMSWVEREFGKEVTSRTWKTVERILARMS